jgi:hypothetical protein
MSLMNHAIQIETHKAQRPDHYTVELVEGAIFPEKAVRRFVQTDQSAMHQMANDKHERDSQPDQPVVHTRGQRQFGEK